MKFGLMKDLRFDDRCDFVHIALWKIINVIQGGPEKTERGYVPLYVDAITGISVRDDMKWYQDQQFRSVVCVLYCIGHILWGNGEAQNVPFHFGSP